MRGKAALLGCAILAVSFGGSGHAALPLPKSCTVINPKTETCTVTFLPRARAFFWAVVAPGGYWKVCGYARNVPADCFTSGNHDLPFDDLAFSEGWTKATLTVRGPLVNGVRRGFGIVSSEPIRPLCVQYLNRHACL